MQQVQLIIIHCQVDHILHRGHIIPEEKVRWLAHIHIFVDPHRVDFRVKHVQVALVNGQSDRLAQPGGRLRQRLASRLPGQMCSTPGFH